MPPIRLLAPGEGRRDGARARLLRRSVLLSLALHLSIAAPLVVRFVVPASVGVQPAPPVMAEVELIQQNTPTVGDQPPSPQQTEKAAPAPSPSAVPIPAPPSPPEAPQPLSGAQLPAPPPQPPQPASPAPPATPAPSADAKSDAEPAIRLGDAGDLGTGLVSGPAVIPAGPGSKVHNKPPAYPREAGERGEQGLVVLLVHIAPDGSASAVDVKESSGYELLDRAARTAVARWHFRPGMEDGLPIASMMEVEVHFVLNGRTGWSGSTGW